jgi:hypothetical protein
MNRVKKIIVYILTGVLLIGCLPLDIEVFAANPENVDLSVDYNTLTGKYDVSYLSSFEPSHTIVRYHNPDGSLTTLTGQEVYSDDQKVTVSLSLEPDHIYDISIETYRNYSDTEPSLIGQIYYLADISFTGESFNEMAVMADIEDKNPILEPDAEGGAVIVRSGENPVIKLRWKVPTFYSAVRNEITYLTVNDTNALNEFALPGIVLDKVCFHISMTVGHGSSTTMDFKTDYSGENMILEGKDVIVSGIENGIVTSPDNYVSLILGKEEGIEPGTEYEFTNIGIIFENQLSEQVPLRRTKLKTDSNNRFLVRNIDNAFSDVGYELSSIYTPMQMELTKIDFDKVEVKFKKITKGIYPELHYQVQYAPRIDDLYTDIEKWVKIPDSAIPASEDYGSEIVTINISGTEHPEYYFRVVFFDSSSPLPRSSSLCIDLRLLGIDTGKPPLPREIKAEPIYAGRKEVTVPTTELSQGKVEIGTSDLKLSFEKPLAWKLIENWDAYKAQDYTGDDYIFHVILSAYLPDSPVETRTKTIGLSETKDIYLPVKQKRVLVLGKKDFYQDPDNPDRLVCIVPGDKLFYDFVSDRPLIQENNEDPSEDGQPGDYPEFLIPNTSYFMQVFTSRYSDNDEIYSDVWADGLSGELLSRMSFKSPILSFTTWPLTEMPVPMPDLKLGIEPEIYIDIATGEMVLEGISVQYDRVLTDAEWQNYTSATTGRAIHYEIFISLNPDSGFNLAATDIAPYPEEAEIIKRPPVIITNSGITLPDGSLEPILPNTVYYIKARSSLYVDGVLIGSSDETAVKAITTPKIDSGGMDDITRHPRAPSEFSIATDKDGNLLLSDASVTLTWLHAEQDVIYEMICTSTNISPQADVDEYISDPYNISFLNAYSDFVMQGENELHLDVASIELQEEGLVLNDANVVIFPIRRDYLRPNRTYFISLRAVRNKGKTDSSGESLETVSRWVTIPVTTKMVKAPAFIEAVRDLEIGFNIQCADPATEADSMEVYLKKAEAGNSNYIRLNRNQYTCVKDKNTYYFRIYNLEPDQWYDIRVKNTMTNRWYDRVKGWTTNFENPYQAKTRNTLNQIEVRWEGEELYDYFLEIRSEYETEYLQLEFKSTGFSDYGYDLPQGGRIEFYKEKTNLYVEEGSPCYIYYALISGKPYKEADGSISHLPLRSNMLYYVKLWANNLEDSLHIGPVSIRTDFSQADYDQGKKEDDTIDSFEYQVEQFSKKLYWRVAKRKNMPIRVIIKDDKVSGLLEASRGSTITVDLTSEDLNLWQYEILIPYKTLSAIERFDSRLNFKLNGAEITLNRQSIDLDALKSRAMSNGAKEAMVLVKAGLKEENPDTRFPSGYGAVSDILNLKVSAIGSRLTYEEIKQIIFNILENPEATGPFKYGILDRELSNILENLENYSYLSHTDMKDMIKSAVNRVETELSLYLEDILDGRSGLPSDIKVNQPVDSFPGRMGIKLQYSYVKGYITPFVNYGAGWSQPSGGKAYVMQYVIFRVEKPGEYAVVQSYTSPEIPQDPSGSPVFEYAHKYDLSKVFGKGTIYSENPVKGEQAIMLYAVLTGQENEIAGMTPIQKISYLKINDMIGARQLTGYVDNQTALSLAVRVYCNKANINPAYIRPARTIVINDHHLIDSKLYRYVVVGIDLGLARLENNRLNPLDRTTIGKILDMMSKALESFE